MSPVLANPVRLGFGRVLSNFLSNWWDKYHVKRNNHYHAEEDDDDEDEDDNDTTDEVSSTVTSMTSKSDYDFVKNPTVTYPVKVQILEILPGQCLRIMLKQNVEKLAQLIKRQSAYDNTCKVTADTNYVLVEKGGSFVVGIQIVASSGHTDFRVINIKIFGCDEEHTVSKSKAGIHEP